MRKKAAVLLLAALLLALTACGRGQNESAEGLSLWFPSGGEDLSSALSVTAYQGEETVPALMDALLAGPGADTGLIPFAPAGTELLDWSAEDRVVQVELSAPYAALEGMDRTLADYCVALTLTQCSGVDGVRITVEGQPQGRVLRAGDAVFSGAEEEPVEVPATLYFPMASGGGLGYEVRTFRLTEDETPAKAVLEALVAGPENGNALVPLLPAELTVYAAWMDGGVCSVNVSSALLDEMPETAEERELVIESVVETLCSLDGVERVQILVEGESVDRYGEIDLSGPLLPEAQDLII